MGGCVSVGADSRPKTIIEIFLPSYDLVLPSPPPPPPPPSVRCLSLPCPSSLLTGEMEGRRRGKEPNHTTAESLIED